MGQQQERNDFQASRNRKTGSGVQAQEIALWYKLLRTPHDSFSLLNGTPGHDSNKMQGNLIFGGHRGARQFGLVSPRLLFFFFFWSVSYLTFFLVLIFHKGHLDQRSKIQTSGLFVQAGWTLTQNQSLQNRWDFGKGINIGELSRAECMAQVIDATHTLI